jgi:hypothetical protein
MQVTAATGVFCFIPCEVTCIDSFLGLEFWQKRSSDNPIGRLQEIQHNDKLDIEGPTPVKNTAAGEFVFEVTYGARKFKGVASNKKAAKAASALAALRTILSGGTEVSQSKLFNCFISFPTPPYYMFARNSTTHGPHS